MRAACACGSCRTTCSRAPPRTRSRSPRRSTSALWFAFRRAHKNTFRPGRRGAPTPPRRSSWGGLGYADETRGRGSGHRALFTRKMPGMRSLVLALALLLASASTAAAKQPPLWRVYNDSLKGAKYIDLTHTITPQIPVWSGFGPAAFAPAFDRSTGERFTYAKNGFEATRYLLQTDQLG